MDISGLPSDCFYHMLNYVPIDCRIKTRNIFPQFEHCFSKMVNVTKHKRAFGLTKLNVSSLMVNKYRKLNVTYDLCYRWDCSGTSHMPSDNFSSNKALMKSCDRCGNSLLVCILKKCPEIESLDLRGITFTVSLVETILLSCPKICCLKMEFSSFDSDEAMELFSNELCPKLKHLSCDNMFINNMSRIFSKTVKLEEAEVILYPNEHTSPNDFNAIPSDKLALLSLRFFQTKTTQLKDLPSHYLAAMNQRIAGSLKFFKIKSNYSHLINYELFREAQTFNNLKAVNLNFMNFYKPEFNFHVGNCWPQLKSLSVDLYCLRGSNKLLSAYLKGSFSRNLETLAIFDCHLKKQTMAMLTQECPNLDSLDLIDISFKDIGTAFDWFGSLPKLRYLNIRFSLKKCNHNEESLRQLAEAYRFPSDKISSIVCFLWSHPAIKKVFFTHWPGLRHEDIRLLDTVVKERHIYIHFKEF